jgi:hypothetical protein
MLKSSVLSLCLAVTSGPLCVPIESWRYGAQFVTAAVLLSSSDLWTDKIRQKPVDAEVRSYRMAYYLQQQLGICGRQLSTWKLRAARLRARHPGRFQLAAHVLHYLAYKDKYCLRQQIHV